MITVLHTILVVPEDYVKETRVSQNNNTETTITRLDSWQDSNAEQQQSLCQTNQPALQLSSLSAQSSSSRGGNETRSNSTLEAAFCDQNQARALANSKHIAGYVRKECRAQNWCTLDLRWPRATQTGSSNGSNKLTEETPMTTSVTATTTTTTSRTNSNAFMLSKLVNEHCQLNRKLVEVVYKCRPYKMSRRTVCRGSQLHLDCPNEKRLVLVSADYGSLANDTKTHDKCLGDTPPPTTTSQLISSTSNNGKNETYTIVSQVRPNQEQTVSKNCLSNSNHTIDILNKHCLYKSTCDVSVTPQVFGEAQCPAGQPEYLKLVYACMNETLLNELSNKSSSATSGRHLAQLELFSQSSSNSNVSSLLSPLNTGSSNVASQVASSQLQLSDASSHQAQEQVTAHITKQSSLLSAATKSQSGGDLLDIDSQVQSDFGQRPSSFVQADSSHSSSVANIQPVSVRLLPKLKYYLIRYNTQLVVLTLSVVSTMFFAMALRSCRLRSAASSSSSGSKTSTCSSKSNYGSSNGSSSQTATTSSNSNQVKHNSCSESCFSLDDYNLTNAGNRSLDSPAGANLSITPLDTNDNSGCHTFSSQTVRPKLWTIYNSKGSNESQATNNPLRMSAHTTRSFVGQQSGQLQLRALQCFHAQQHQQATGQQKNARDSLSSANDLLLQTAQVQQHMMLPSQQQTNNSNWCTTLNQHEFLQPTENHSIAHLQQQQQQQQMSAVSAPQQCAFHAQSQPAASMQFPLSNQQQQQQHCQQHLVFSPQNIQLELAPRPGATILAPLQQQQQQPAPVETSRQFHPNFQP